MKVIYWTIHGQGFFEAEKIDREFKKSTRFILPGGEKITINRGDILSIEYEQKKPEHENVKLRTGRYYSKENWDKWIEIIGFIDGDAILKGWTISFEPIRTDKNGNEYIRLENLTYPAYCTI